MKRASSPLLFCLVAALGIGGSAARAGKVEWRTDLEAASRESVTTGKPMLLKFTASWCGYCHKMERTTYSDEAIAKHVNDCFVPVKVDADQNEELVKALAISGLPTTVVVSPQMQVLGRIKGYKTADVVGQALAEVCQAGHEQPAAGTPETRVAARPASATAAEPAPLAFGGHCLVTLRQERRLHPGNRAVTLGYHGLELAFADEEARTEFAANPAYYWPMWDGNCPVTAVDEGRSVQGEPSTGAIYRDRLWFFADRGHREEFDAAPTRYLPSVAAEKAETSTR